MSEQQDYQDAGFEEFRAELIDQLVGGLGEALGDDVEEPADNDPEVVVTITLNLAEAQAVLDKLYDDIYAERNAGDQIRDPRRALGR